MVNSNSNVDRATFVGSLDPNRLIELRKARGLSQEELARRTNSTQPSINRLEGGGTNRPRNLLELARELETTPEYLLGETNDPSPARSKAQEAPRKATPIIDDDDDTVEIAEIDLRYGLGATYLDNAVTAEKRRFSREWLRNFTRAAPASLFWATGDGDSMEPTIRSGEVILIDGSQTTPRMGEGIWAVALGDFGMVKRIHYAGADRIELLSDNVSLQIPPIPVGEGELHVIGRVVAVVRRL